MYCNLQKKIKNKIKPKYYNTDSDYNSDSDSDLKLAV